MRKGFTLFELIVVVVIILVLALLLGMGLRGIFSSNWGAKHWGGTTSIKIPAGWKLVNITWKADEIWALVQNNTTGEMEFKEYSSFGVFQGTVKIKQDQ